MSKGLGMGTVGGKLTLSGTAKVVEDKNNRRTVDVTVDDIAKNHENTLSVSDIAPGDLTSFQDGERVIVTLDVTKTDIKKG